MKDSFVLVIETLEAQKRCAEISNSCFLFVVDPNTLQVSWMTKKMWKNRSMFGASSKPLFRREVKVAKMCMEKFTLVAFYSWRKSIIFWKHVSSLSQEGESHMCGVHPLVRERGYMHVSKTCNTLLFVMGEALKMCLINFTLLFFFFYLWCSSIPSKWAERQKRYEKIDSFLVPEWGSFVKVVWAQIFLFIFKIK